MNWAGPLTSPHQPEYVNVTENSFLLQGAVVHLHWLTFYCFPRKFNFFLTKNCIIKKRIKIKKTDG
jgi:hypothetical protein